MMWFLFLRVIQFKDIRYRYMKSILLYMSYLIIDISIWDKMKRCYVNMY